MSKSKTYTVQFKRKRNQKTDYKKRLKYLKSEKTRIVVRTSTNSIIIQAIDFQENGDKILSTVHSKDLQKLGWKYNCGNIPSAYLTGFYFGIKNKDKIKEAIIDLGLKSITKGDRSSTIIKGIVDSGLKIPYSDKLFPKEEKINGTTIVEYAKSLSNDKEKYEKQFSKYLKNNLNPENIKQDFDKTKELILSNKK
jgi:large subunit ribosomal protein L18